jgi:hypothetical protein
MEIKEYAFICTDDYLNHDGDLCFKKNNNYLFINKNELFFTKKNHLGYSHELDLEDIKNHFKPIPNELQTPNHYDNSKGTLYKVATERNWNPYLFDIVKRLERAEKKGEFKTDLEKSINVIKLWLQEYEVNN